MTEVAPFNRIPLQCAGVCELEQEFVDKHGIVLTKNCAGPKVDNVEPESRVLVVGGEVAGLDIETGSYEQRPICRNIGFAAWTNAREQQFKQKGE